MDLLEYQAKQLFQQVGIPVLPSQSILDPSELKDLQIPYPIVLKSQVRASSRTKVGGVKFVENTIDAIAAAQAIFHLPIEDEYPEVVLAEARYDVQNELFLAIMFDYQLKKPVLLGSSAGGIDIEKLLANLQTCVIDSDFSPFYARRLVKEMGFSGKIILSISEIIEKMYELFVSQDLEVIEINPLGINYNGEVMALDGKIRVNDEALARHPQLLELIGINTNQNNSLDENLRLIELTHKLSYFEINLHSNLAIITNSIDLGIFVSNLIIEQQGTVNSCFILPCESLEIFNDRLNNIIEQIFDSTNIEIVLVHLMTDSITYNLFLDGVIKYYQTSFTGRLNSTENRLERPTGKRFKLSDSKKVSFLKPLKKVSWLVRIIDQDLSKFQEKVTNFPIKITKNLMLGIELSVQEQLKKNQQKN